MNQTKLGVSVVKLSSSCGETPYCTTSSAGIYSFVIGFLSNIPWLGILIFKML